MYYVYIAILYIYYNSIYLSSSPLPTSKSRSSSLPSNIGSSSISKTSSVFIMHADASRCGQRRVGAVKKWRCGHDELFGSRVVRFAGAEKRGKDGSSHRMHLKGTVGAFKQQKQYWKQPLHRFSRLEVRRRVYLYSALFRIFAGHLLLPMGIL